MTDNPIIQPQPYLPPAAQQPPKKKRTGRKIALWGCLTPLAFLLLIVIVVTANGGGGTKTASTSVGGMTITNGPAAAQPTQPAHTTTTTPPPPPPKEYSGKGDDVVQIDPSKGLAIVVFECPKCTGNTVLKSDGDESLLVNTIGSYTGKRWINVHDGSVTHELTVTAKGSWKITVGDIRDLATHSDGTAPAVGTGDNVVMITGNSRTAAISNKGKSNFVVEVLSATGQGLDLAVNEIGSYEGTVKLGAPALVQVTSSGNWTVTPAG